MTDLLQTPDYCLSGDVSLHPAARIAPGVVLQAAPGARIEIGEGVCIGLGSILHAYGGILRLEAGATLGQKVLLLGAGAVGRGACIGAEATLFNPALADFGLVPPQALWGDPSQAAPEPTSPQTQPLPSPWEDEQPAVVSEPESAPLREVVLEVALDPPEPEIPAPKVPVVGQVYINQLLVTLFPERRKG
ncbi:MAG: carbon dioxide concentrating mechanism protein [Cyanobacteriota bacterium]|jgi:carbon dioxide concentrating mechanism protein CcmN